MPLIQLLEVLIVVGVLLWLVNRFIPMQGSIKSILNGVVVIAVVLWLLNVFGLFHSLSRHPRREGMNGKRSYTEMRYERRLWIEATRQRPAPRRYCEDKVVVSSRNHAQFERVRSNQFPNHAWSSNT